jgi:ribosomal protein S8
MFFKVINTVKISYILKKKNLKIKLNKNDISILKIFLKLNIIKLIKHNNNNIYTISFQYINNSIIFNNIKNLNKPSKPYIINLKQILEINKKKNHILFLSTNKGLITNFEAEKYKIGGVAIMQIKI